MSFNHLHSACLVLEDGAFFTGFMPILQSPALGEAVFNTSHTGYQEILTDPSYARQIVVFTAPHIGNVGVNPEDYESDRIQAAGAVVKSLSPHPSNWRSKGGLTEWLSEAGSPVLTGADTRAITLHLRQYGAKRAGIFPSDIPLEEALRLVKESPPMVNADLTAGVSCNSSYTLSQVDCISTWSPSSEDGSGLKVAILDFGLKRNIMRQLSARGCQVVALPGRTPAEEIIKGCFDGVLISNGPGDPAAVTYGIETIRALMIQEMPLFGICLGHQMLALAAGMQTFKLPFGHRGANHPVRREADGVVEITSQNHGFGVRAENVPSDWIISHINLNDGTVEGLAHRRLPFFSIQYHPEASPGPHEGWTYFDRFIGSMRRA